MREIGPPLAVLGVIAAATAIDIVPVIERVVLLYAGFWKQDGWEVVSIEGDIEFGSLGRMPNSRHEHRVRNSHLIHGKTHARIKGFRKPVRRNFHQVPT